jgi:hypothetical protein
MVGTTALNELDQVWYAYIVWLQVVLLLYALDLVYRRAAIQLNISIDICS